MKIACCGPKTAVKERETRGPDGPYQYEQCGARTDGKNIKMRVIGGVCLAVLIIIILALATALSVLQTKPCDPGKERKDHSLLPCQDGWIFYLGICYFFSETEGNWTDSQRFCASQNASLAVIATQKEMDFVMRFKGVDDHWIGLSREPKGEWKWPNGTAFNNWFEIKGDSNCAYLNHDGARNARCYADRKWICTISDVLGHHRKSLSTGDTTHDPRKDN